VRLGAGTECMSEHGGSDEPEVSWEEVKELESSMATSKETLGEGLTPIVGNLGELSLTSETGAAKAGLGPGTGLYPEVPRSGSAAGEVGKKSKGPKCCGCGKSICKDQLEAAIKCPCPGEEAGAPTTFCHKGCRVTILQVIAASRGYVNADGVGDYKHPEFMASLSTAAPFFAEAGSGMVAGYMDTDGLYCNRCVSKMQTPCAPRHLFDCNADVSSSDEEAATLQQANETFTTAVSAPIGGEPTKTKLVEAAGGEPSRPPPPKYEEKPRQALSKEAGKEEVQSLTARDFEFVALIARQAASGDGSLSGSQAVLVGAVMNSVPAEIRDKAAAMGWRAGADFPLWASPRRWDDLSRALDEFAKKMPGGAGPARSAPRVEAEAGKRVPLGTPTVSTPDAAVSADMVLRLLHDQHNTLAPGLSEVLHHVLLGAHEEVYSAGVAVLGWDPAKARFSRLTSLALFKAVLSAYEIPRDELHGSSRPAAAQAAAVAQDCAAVGDAYAGRAGYLGQVSLADLGAEEAAVVAGNSRLPDQASGARGGAGSSSGGAGRQGAARFEEGILSGVGPSSAIERTLAAPAGQRGGQPHQEVAEMRELLDVTETHEALSAGDNSLAGLVLTTMESPEEVRRMWKRVRGLRARLLGLPARVTAAEITDDGDVKVTWGLVCETKSVGDWDAHELAHWIEHTEGLVGDIDLRDGSALRRPWRRLLELTRAKKAKFWGLGIRTTAHTAEADLRVTLNLIAALRWLIRSPEIGGSGHSISEIWREFLDEAGGQTSAIKIQTPERLRALKKAQGGGAALQLPAISTEPVSRGIVPPSPTSVDAGTLMWGPLPGQEPTPEQVKETEVGFLNPNWCKNCHQNAGHPTPLCPRPRRPDLPCVFCMGRHRELDCPGPSDQARPAFEVKRKFFFNRVDSAIPKRINNSREPGAEGKSKGAAPPGAKGNGVWIDAGMTPPGGERGGEGGQAPARG